MHRRCFPLILALASIFARLAATAPAAPDRPEPFFRSLPPPRVLYVADNASREEFAEILRHKMPAKVTFVPISYDDLDNHHLCDKPLEEKDEDVAAVAQAGAAYMAASLMSLATCKVVILQIPPSSGDTNLNRRLAAYQQRIVEWTRRGGNLIVINSSWETVFENTPLAPVVPVKFDGRKAWTTRCGSASDDPLSRGLPLEVIGTHWYGPVYAPADESCVGLTTNKGMAQFWVRPLPGGGKAVHLYNVYGGLWQWNGPGYGAYEAERPDDVAAWDSLMQRLIYGLTYGDKAFPVLAKLEFPAVVLCRRGDSLVVPLNLENRSDRDQVVTAAIEVGHRRTERVISRSVPVTLKKGERTTVNVECPIDLPCTDPFVSVKGRVLDSSGRFILSESVAWLPYSHVVPLEVTTEKPGYQAGEEVKFAVKWPDSAAPGSYKVDALVVDRTGRALRRTGGTITVATKAAGTWTPSLVMPDGGPSLASCYWIAAVVSDGKEVLGSARAQVSVDRPWER